MPKIINIDKNKLEDLYINQNKSAIDIAKIFKCGDTAILNRLKKYKIPIRNYFGKGKYSKKENIFETPDVNNCYYAGFIAADGCIYKPKPSKNINPRYRLVISLSSKDRNLLEEFIIYSNYSGKIIDTQHKIYGEDKSNFLKNEYSTATLSICFIDKWMFDLNKHWNITPRKSLTLQPPNITDLDLCLSYIVGYIDGDGCINIAKDRNNREYMDLSILGTKELLEWINNKVDNIGTIIEYKTIFRLRFRCGKACKVLNIFENIISKYNLPVLKRKWNKIIEYKIKRNIK